MINHYNSYVRADGDDKVSTDSTNNYKINCKIVGVMSQSYGKFGRYAFRNEIVMEYNEFFPYILDYFPEEVQDNEPFMDYMSSSKILE